jgi:fatty-acyl-CoA synthase
MLTGIRSSSAGLGLAGPELIQLSWLPFFHDWGLGGHLLWPIVMGNEAHFLPTERFARDPSEWLRLVGRVGASLTPGPTSAWAAALRVVERRPKGVDLSTLRTCDLGAERIDPLVVDRMLQVGADLGLRPTAPIGVYGMAETTLGISVGRVDQQIRIETVDHVALADGKAIRAQGGGGQRIASCGWPIPGMDVRIAGPDGSALPEERLGEIWVRGPSVMSGYVGSERADPFTEGWFRTGDLGYLHAGELFVTGRLKDIVIVMGRNYAPHDFEWAAEAVPGVKAGRCVAFGRDAVEGQVVIVAEVSPGVEPDALPRLVWEAVMSGVGISPHEILVLPRGTIPMTTSGKLRRGWVREAYASGELRSVAVAAGPAIRTSGAANEGPGETAG